MSSTLVAQMEMEEDLAEDHATAQPAAGRGPVEIVGVRLIARHRLVAEYPALIEALRAGDAPTPMFDAMRVEACPRGAALAWRAHRARGHLALAVGGAALLALYDGREQSPTRGAAHRVVLRAYGWPVGGWRLAVIPAGVWYGFAALDCDEARLVTIPVGASPTGDELTLPWDSPVIPFPWPPGITRAA